LFLNALCLWLCKWSVLCRTLVVNGFQVTEIFRFPIIIARLKLFVAMKIHVGVFWLWHRVPCSVVVGCQRFGGPCCLHLQGEVIGASYWPGCQSTPSYTPCSVCVCVCVCVMSNSKPHSLHSEDRYSFIVPYCYTVSYPCTAWLTGCLSVPCDVWMFPNQCINGRACSVS
jgi:hypothetical protein